MKAPGELVLTLLNARTAAHIAHLSVSGAGAYAAHVALAEFYEGISKVADRFAEAYMGCYGEQIKFTGSSFKLEKDPLRMLDNLKALLWVARGECDKPYLQQIIDDGLELIGSTSYKLKFLK